ncbi:MAG TPA: fibrillarin-like rRNA/tRNA 2'-O-methyltransferase [Candidatus Woesearchaeota archaeon]|nr:fibrillarin-like rRNA/tRNA 2'-O-methyltransferase [Candidatus Woesearchaeota archaeon]
MQKGSNPRVKQTMLKGKKVFATESLAPGKSVYGESLISLNGKEYREWVPFRSKIAAGLMNGLRMPELSMDSVVLYLGAASGTTVSHISDIVSNGLIFAVEVSPHVTYSLISLAEARGNIVPVLEDANKPEEYFNTVIASDFVFQDIAQKNQVEIFLKNCRLFLKQSGFAMISIKARSIDISKKPRRIFEEVRKELEQRFREVKPCTLEPFQKDHCLFLCLGRE